MARAMESRGYWTVDRAAEHFKVARGTIERYVRDGLPVHFPELGGFLKRTECEEHYRNRNIRQKATRYNTPG